MTTEIDTLREEAKALKIKSWHMLGEDRLVEEIQKAKAEAPAEQPRKKAPRMQVATAKGSSRKLKIKELDRMNPEYKHQYRPVTTDPRIIEAQGFEVVPGETLGEEIVVRTMRDSFDEWQGARNSTEADKMQRGIDESGEKIKRLSSSPKDHVKEKT